MCVSVIFVSGSVIYDTDGTGLCTMHREFVQPCVALCELADLN